MRIPFLNIEIAKGKLFDRISMKAQDADLARPSLDFKETLGGEGIRMPVYAFPPQSLYDLAAYSDTLSTVLQALRREVFRKGIVIKPKFASKCASCGKEFKDKTSEACDECGSLVIEPDSRQKIRFENWSKDVNENHQSLKEVLESIHYDLDVMDDGFLLILKDYYWDANGQLTGGDIREVLRGSPLRMRVIADVQGRPGRDDNGEPVYTCLEHRDQVHRGINKCPQCKKQLFKALFVSEFNINNSRGVQNRLYYTEGEVVHFSKYHPSLTYGFSCVASLWQKVVTLMYQDSYIKEAYGKERPPRGILLVNTSNRNSMEKAWNQYREQLRREPHDIHPIPIEFPEGKAGNMVEWIEFLKSLPEMEFVETRNEYRRAIGALYGVQPLFQSDVQQTGGLNNEGLQITVTNRAVELGQDVMNRFLSVLAEQLAVTDFEVKLAPLEAKDQMSGLMLQEKKIQIAQLMKNIGYDVEMDEEGEFEFEKSENPQPAPFTPFPQPQQVMPENEGEPEKPDFEGETNNALKSKHLADVKNTIKREVQDEEIESDEEAEDFAREYDESIQIYAHELKPEKGEWGHEQRQEIKSQLRRYLWQILKEKVAKRKTNPLDLVKALYDTELDYLTAEDSFSKKADLKPETLAALQDAVFSGKFKDVGKRKSEAIKNYLVKAVAERKGEGEMKSKLVSMGLDEQKAELIVRTEAHELRMTAREAYYKDNAPEDAKFKWTGPADSRTTEVCKNITQRTKEGVPLEKIKAIINDEAKKAGFDARGFTPHPQCRHVVIRAY